VKFDLLGEGSGQFVFCAAPEALGLKHFDTNGANIVIIRTSGCITGFRIDIVTACGIERKESREGQTKMTDRPIMFIQ